MSILNSRKLDPQELEQLLWQLGKTDGQLWQQLLIGSEGFIEQANQQLMLFYQKRNFWQHGVKVAVATLGIASLALGAAAVPVLYISSIILFINFVINHYIADVHQSEYIFSANIKRKNLSSTEKHLLQQKINFWQDGVEQHKFKLENNNHQKNIYKVGGALVLSYAFFIILNSQLSVALVLGVALYLSSLLIEAKQEAVIYSQ